MKNILSILLLLTFAVPVFPQGGKKNKKNKPATPEATSAEEQDLRRVTPVFDPGSHTRPICAMGFTPDKSRLITVGQDYTVQIWSTATGERLDILRLPGYGREKGFDGKDWDAGAVSPDGNLIALGGGQKHLIDDGNRMGLTKLVLVDVRRREVQRFTLTLRGLGVGSGRVSALAFSADGDRLAMAFDGQEREIRIYAGLRQAFEPDRRSRFRDFVLVDSGHDSAISTLAFSPDGSRLIAAGASRSITIWKSPSNGKLELDQRVDVEGMTTAVEWSPQGDRFLRTWTAFEKPRGFDLRQPNGDVIKRWELAKVPEFPLGMHANTIRFLGPDDVLISGSTHSYVPSMQAVAIKFNLTKETVQRLVQEQTAAPFTMLGVTSSDQQLGAFTSSMGMDAVVYRLQSGAVVARCGSRSPIPTQVGWSTLGQPVGFAWSEQDQTRRAETNSTDLEFGFNLETVAPLAAIQTENYGVSLQKQGEWSLRLGSSEATNNSPTEFALYRGDQFVQRFRGGNRVSALSLIPRENQDPLVVWGIRTFVPYQATLLLSKSDGGIVANFRPEPAVVKDLAPSPDGNYFIAATGTHRLCVYATDGSRHPVLSFARVNGEWVAWTPEGYYSASPGGEKMFGWAVGHGFDELATFHPAEKFAHHFRRPDMIRKAVGLQAKQPEERGVDPILVDQILPPTARLELIKHSGKTVQVRASASSPVADKPVVSLRVLLDGKALGQGRGVLAVAAGKPAEATFEFDIPSGPHQIKLQARNEYGTASSAPLTVTAPKSPDQQPSLYRLSVGVDQYDQPGLKLTSAAKDARDVYEALEKYCVGPNNRFGKTQGYLLLNRDATRDAVQKSLEKIREQAKPGDCVVVFFAGHGIKQGKNYYLLTREANPTKSLEGASLSGDDLRQELQDVQCPVLLILDACHSAAANKSFLPATDALAGNLADESTGVTVLGAAMSHEVANASVENGYFTAALLKALQAGDGVPHDPYDHTLYAHHIYSVVFSEVRRATHGRQNPFLNMPWTDLPLALREVQ